VSSFNERRINPRFRLRVPLVFCPVNTPPEWGIQAKSVNISARGVFFQTDRPVTVGLPVRVLINMPKRLSHRGAATRYIFTGRVSHVKGKDHAPGSEGVGVEFFYREAITEAISDGMRGLANLLPTLRPRSDSTSPRSNAAVNPRFL
jgi:Tfp pilus assembly protein PilZ